MILDSTYPALAGQGSLLPESDIKRTCPVASMGAGEQNSLSPANHVLRTGQSAVQEL